MMKCIYITKDFIQLKEIGKFSSKSIICKDISEIYNHELKELHIKDANIDIIPSLRVNTLVLYNSICKINNESLKKLLITDSKVNLDSRNIEMLYIYNSSVIIDSFFSPKVLSISNSNISGKGHELYQSKLFKKKLIKFIFYCFIFSIFLRKLLKLYYR